MPAHRDGQITAILPERQALNATPGTYDGPEPADESEHFYVCAGCGQAVDMRRLGDVFHHDDEGHAPIPLNA